MAMNFWEAQKRARSRTAIYLTLFLLITATAAVAVEWAMRYLGGEDYNTEFPYVGVFFAAVTLLTAGVQYAQFGLYGGSYVAEAVGGYKVDPATTDFNERKLLNIVQEIAIAASLPVPPVYILKTPQINAFAAGLQKENAAIAVTEGTLMRLNRDELQGVIAHEFGHIYNGDMKISMRLAAMCMGFFFVLYIAMRLLQFSDFSGRSSNRDNKGNSVALAALVFLVAGAFTYLFGSILKAAVSREREYLADACAVQFTRNPDGIANALRKISREANYNEMPSEGVSFSHLYFDDRGGFSALFATHPPLKKRIEAIEGRTYLPEEWKEDLK